MPDILQEQTCTAQDTVNHGRDRTLSRGLTSTVSSPAEGVRVDLQAKVGCCPDVSLQVSVLEAPDSVVITTKCWPAAAAPPSIIHHEERFVLFNLRDLIMLSY